MNRSDLRVIAIDRFSDRKSPERRKRRRKEKERERERERSVASGLVVVRQRDVSFFG
jgi:hypothetical protein